MHLSPILRPIVNRGSHFALALAFVFAALAPAPARAASVAVFPPTGRADEARRAELAALLREILEAQGHAVQTPIGEPPAGSVAMRASAAANDAEYVLTAEIEPFRAQYRLHVHVFTASRQRLEELVVLVVEAEERERLSDVLSSMVRPEGLGDDAVRLTGLDDPEGEARRRTDEEARRAAAAQRQADEEEARRAADAQRALEEAEAEEARRAAAEAEARQARWDARPRYDSGGDFHVQVGVGGTYAAALGAQSGGGLLDLQLRVGYRAPFLEGLEFRAGLDGVPGDATRGLGLMAGASWQGSFFDVPIFVGAQLEAGAFFSTTGSRNAAFRGQLGPVASWRPFEGFSVEVSPTVGVLTAGDGAVTVGGWVRGGYRF